ncbi:MAG: NfeD family protein [Pseudomonas sp.]|uniref:NfeD family protein n=1 Tax=Pseudomonas sp. TaxID=306 RepID=UPI003D095BD4
MITYLQHLSFWDWVALATLLLILEVFGAGGYLLWVGLVAVVVGALTYLFPELPWAWQFLLFGTLALLSALFWWRHQHRTNRARN